MNTMRHTTRSTLQREALFGVAWLVTLAVVVGALLVGRDDLDSATLALALLASSIVAALGSLRLSIIAALVSAVLFNVLFIPPYGSWRIASDASVVAFVVYPLIAVSMGLVLHRLRRQMEVSEQRAAEATLVRDLTVDLVRQDVWLQPPLAAALGDLHAALGLRGAVLAVRIEGGASFEVTAGDPGRARRAAHALINADRGVTDSLGVRSIGDDGAGVATWPVATGTTVYGVLAIDGGSSARVDLDERVTRSFANVVALACERAELVQRTIQQQTLEATDRVRTSLMQAVTHDLRTPLTSIRALASTMPALGALTDEQTEIVAEIEVQSERLAQLVDRVLDLGRIESGQLQLHLATVAIDDVVHAALDAFRRPGSPDVSVSIEAGLPAVAIDEQLMVQVIVNLLENARRHGEPPFEIIVARTGDRIELRVVDHGAGVAESERRRLFEAGHAMRRATADERNHGLGLAITSGFVDAHGGHVRVDPTPGGGATFVVSLPEGGGGA